MFDAKILNKKAQREYKIQLFLGRNSLFNTAKITQRKNITSTMTRKKYAFPTIYGKNVSLIKIKGVNNSATKPIYIRYWTTFWIFIIIENISNLVVLSEKLCRIITNVSKCKEKGYTNTAVDREVHSD